MEEFAAPLRIILALAVGSVLLLAGCSGSNSAPSPPVVTSAPSPAPAPTPTPTPAPLPVRDPARFDQTFWNEFVHNSFDAPGSIAPLRRLTSAPRLYVRTVDEKGQSIDFATLNTVITAMRDVASTWGGGQFGLADVVQGTDTREGQSGWITVKWPNPSAGAFCGLSTVAMDGGWIQLNYLRPEGCGCGAARMRTRTARHELGHAFGYYHTDSDQDVMKNGVNGCAETMPSAREIYHAQLAYQSPIGSSSALPARDGITIED